MSISSALSNAVSGMNAASRRAEVTSHNITNATTEGYARQTVSTTQKVVGGNGAGVLVDNTRRNTDAPVTAGRRDAEADANGSGVQATAARSLADVFGGGGSLFERLSALETSLRSVTETPQSSALQERAVTAAGQVVSAFDTASATIETERTNADHAIHDIVGDVNNALKEVEHLNLAIDKATTRGTSTAAYEQDRATQLDIVASHVPVRLMARENGRVAVLTDTGVTLLDSTVRPLEFQKTTVVTAEMDRRGGAGGLSGLSVDGFEITPGVGNQSISGGTLAGLFETRDGGMVEANTEIDALAADIIDRFETAGITGLDGRGLFTDAGSALSSPSAPGLAGRIVLNDRVDPAQGGETWRIRDGFNAVSPGPSVRSDRPREMLEAMTEARITSGSLSRPASASGLAADLGSLFERRGQALEDTAAGDIARLSTIRSAETGSVGVDLDQELQSLILIEQAYGANAKVIQVADRLIQRLLEI